MGTCMDIYDRKHGTLIDRVVYNTHTRILLLYNDDDDSSNTSNLVGQSTMS